MSVPAWFSSSRIRPTTAVVKGSQSAVSVDVDGSRGIPHADRSVQRKFQHVLGIDLGGGKGKKTALATLRVDGSTATVVATCRPYDPVGRPRMGRRSKNV